MFIIHCARCYVLTYMCIRDCSPCDSGEGINKLHVIWFASITFIVEIIWWWRYALGTASVSLWGNTLGIWIKHVRIMPNVRDPGRTCRCLPCYQLIIHFITMVYHKMCDTSWFTVTNMQAKWARKIMHYQWCYCSMLLESSTDLPIINYHVMWIMHTLKTLQMRTLFFSCWPPSSWVVVVLNWPEVSTS